MAESTGEVFSQFLALPGQEEASSKRCVCEKCRYLTVALLVSQQTGYIILFYALFCVGVLLVYVSAAASQPPLLTYKLGLLFCSIHMRFGNPEVPDATVAIIICCRRLVPWLQCRFYSTAFQLTR